MKKEIIIASIIGGSLITSIFGYSYMNYKLQTEKEEQRIKESEELLKVEKQKLQQEKSREQEKKRSLNACLYQVNINSRLYWDGECDNLGREKNCRLPKSRADRAEKHKKEANDNCIKLYK